MIAVGLGPRSRGGFVLAAAFAVGCGCPGGAGSKDGVHEIDASDAVLHATASRLRVRGTARLEDAIDHRVALDTESSRTTKWFHLVPVVDGEWSEGDPVPLWITSGSSAADVESWKRALASALARGPIDVEVVARAGLDAREKPRGWHEALEALEASGGPTSDPRAPIAVWPRP